MDRKTNILSFFLIVLILLSVSGAYYKFIIQRDYVVQNLTDCDPDSESCFVWECDPEIEECTGNPDEDVWFYKIQYRDAKYIELCDLDNLEDCEPMSCEPGEPGCYEVLCTEETSAVYESSCSPESMGE